MEETRKIIRDQRGREIGYKIIYKDSKGRITGSSDIIDSREKEPIKEKKIGIDEKAMREAGNREEGEKGEINNEEMIEIIEKAKEKAKNGTLQKITKDKAMPHTDKKKKTRKKKKKKSE